MKKRTKLNKKYNYLTILRAIAFFGVSLFHTYSHFVPGGYLAVIIFLVLSGFLTLKTADNKTYDIKTKLKVKFINILSPVYLIMATSLIFSFIFARTIFDDSIKSVLPVALNFENIRRIIAGDDYFNQLGNFNMFLHMWYVSLYMQFIAIFLIIDQFLNNPKKNNKRILVYSILTIISFVSIFLFGKSPDDITRIYYAIDTRFSAFGIGILAYLINEKFDKGKIISESTYKIAILILGLVLIIPFFLVNGKNISSYHAVFIIYTIAVGILIAFLYNYERINIINHRKHTFLYNFLIYIGERSFHLYLWQYIVQIFVVYLAPSLMDNILLNLLAQFLIVIVLSEISFQLLKSKNLRKYALMASLLVFIILSIASHVLGNSKNDEIDNLRNDIKASQEKIDQANKEILEKNKKENADKFKRKEAKPLPETKKLDDNFKEKSYDDFDFSEKELEYLSNLNVTAVGDSVIINADSYIRKFIPNFYLDGEVGRDMVSGPDILTQIKKTNGLGDIVLVSLGSNGSANTNDMEKILEIAGDRDVYFVNTSHTQSYMDFVNNSIKEFCASHDKAHMVDWRSFIKDRPDYLAKDRTHPNIPGSDSYAKLLIRKILNVNKIAP